LWEAAHFGAIASDRRDRYAHYVTLSTRTALVLGALIISFGSVEQLVVATEQAGTMPVPRKMQVDRRRDADAVRISEATSILSDLLARDDDAALRSILDNAEGIAIFPAQDRVPARRGQGPITRRTARMLQVDARGILSVRAGRTWSPPAFLTVTGGDVPEGADLILVMVNRRGVEKMMQHRFEVDLDAAVAAGPTRSATTRSESLRQADIVAYTRQSGLLTGISFHAGVVEADPIANQRFYGERLTTARTLERSTAPDAATEWREALSKQSAR
jgi:lipid-binding SYLF domain-containing protein